MPRLGGTLGGMFKQREAPQAASEAAPAASWIDGIMDWIDPINRRMRAGGVLVVNKNTWQRGPLKLPARCVRAVDVPGECLPACLACRPREMSRSHARALTLCSCAADLGRAPRFPFPRSSMEDDLHAVLARAAQPRVIVKRKQAARTGHRGKRERKQ